MDLVLGVVSFTGIVLLLVVVILLARSQLVASGNVSITINGDEENKLEVQTGSKLLQTLAASRILILLSLSLFVFCWSLRDTAVKETNSEQSKQTPRVTPKVFIIVSFIMLLCI